MLFSRALGTILMVAQGLMLTILLALLAWLQDVGWPAVTLMASSNVVSTFTISIGLVFSQTVLPPSVERKWVFLTGSLMAVSALMLALAVWVGTPLGDIAALTTINVVTAVLLGRIFLGEPHRWLHAFAVGCSLLGALLISRPSFLFDRSGSSSTGAVSGVGYLLASVSGFLDACILICCRKSPETSSWFHTISFTSQSSLVFLLLSLTPLVENFSMERVVAAPWQAVAFILALSLTDLLGMTMYCFAAKWCPAAMSATVDTGSRMIFGYIAQVVLFGIALQPLTMIGATLMLIGVITMANVREPDATLLEAKGNVASGLERDEGRTLEVGASEVSANSIPDAEGDSDTESLVSFIASEFAGVPLHQKPLRQRRLTDSASTPSAQTIGVISTVVAASI